MSKKRRLSIERPPAVREIRTLDCTCAYMICFCRPFLHFLLPPVPKYKRHMYNAERDALFLRCYIGGGALSAHGGTRTGSCSLFHWYYKRYFEYWEGEGGAHGLVPVISTVRKNDIGPHPHRIYHKKWLRFASRFSNVSNEMPTFSPLI